MCKFKELLKAKGESCDSIIPILTVVWSAKASQNRYLK